MKYNDFQIFDEQTYQVLSNNYQSANHDDRRTLSIKLFIELTNCYNHCYSLEKIYNKQILLQIEAIKNALKTSIENLKANFTFSEIKTQTEPCSIFKLISKLLLCINICNNWIMQEEKEYYKNLLKNIFSSLLSLILNLIKIFEKINIKFFKHM